MDVNRPLQLRLSSRRGIEPLVPLGFSSSVLALISYRRILVAVVVVVAVVEFTEKLAVCKGQRQ